MLLKFLLPGIAFMLTLAFGFWVSHVGKPYNVALFNVHKLIALGAVVATVIQLTKLLKGGDVLVIVLLVVAALCVIALFASGALMSMGKLDYVLMLTVHRVAPVVLVVAMVIVILMLNGA